MTLVGHVVPLTREKQTVGMVGSTGGVGKKKVVSFQLSVRVAGPAGLRVRLDGVNVLIAHSLGIALAGKPPVAPGAGAGSPDATRILGLCGCPPPEQIVFVLVSVADAS